MRVHHEKRSDWVRVDHEKSDWVRDDHEKKSDGLRVDHKKKSDGVKVHHERKRNGVRVDHERKSDGVRVDHEEKNEGVKVYHEKKTSRTSGELLLPVSRGPSHREFTSQTKNEAPSRILTRASPWWFTWQTLALLLCYWILTHTMP